MATANLILGDCIEKMKELPADSIDAVITDPPYFMGNIVKRFGSPDAAEAQYGTDGSFQRLGRGFMGKTWDGFTDLYEFQAWNKKWATEALRVLKPGGFMFAMGGTRTHHRLTCGIEDAGFMIRDELSWVYMQGFPKAQDLGMLIEKKLGGEGEDVGIRKPFGRENATTPCGYGMGLYQKESGRSIMDANPRIVVPTLPLAKEWQGWKTPALKPAFEPIVVAQKPCEGSITENVMKRGVGGYNIDECRIAFESQDDHIAAAAARAHQQERCNTEGHNTVVLTPNGDSRLGNDPQEEFDRFMTFKGRYPSNLLMQEECFGRLSKFFLIPKASKGEKEENLEGDGKKEMHRWNSGGEWKECEKEITNKHPTVKPVALMQHLIKLTTKPLYTVLDPFLGSGTTAVAALQLNRNVIGIELNEEYMKIAKARIAEEVKQTRLFQ